MVGRDGVVGASSSGDQKTSINRAVVQFGGEALVCPPEVLKKVLQQSAALLSAIASHEHALFAQAQQSTACMAAHDIQSRLSRWLLRVRDLSGTDSVLVTQEFLAEMLGVRRTSVTVAAFCSKQD
jgi:CRP-like cAMP-binding protein